MTTVSRTIHTTDGWTVSLYDDGSVTVQESGEDPTRLPESVVESIAGLHG